MSFGNTPVIKPVLGQPQRRTGPATHEEEANLRHRRGDLWTEMRDLLDIVEKRDGAMRSDEQRKYDAAEREFDALTDQISAIEAQHAADRGGMVGRRGERVMDGPFLSRSGSMAGWVEERGLAERDDVDVDEQRAFSLGACIRGLVTGRWDGAPAEQRVLSSGASATGGILVPTLVSAQVIDALVDRATAIQAGARIVPMGSESVVLPKVASLPTPGWRAQNGPVVEGQPSFGGLKLTAKTLAILCTVPFELFEDVSAEASAAISTALTTSLALELDRAAYFGDGTNDSPVGLVNTAGVSKTPLAANGAVLADYSALTAAFFAVRRRNALPNAAVYSERTAEGFANLSASDGQPLLPPPALRGLTEFSTNAIPDDQDAGTSTDVASSIIVGQFDQLAIGVRPEVGFRVVSNQKLDNMQVQILAYLRADVGVVNVDAFDVRTGVLAA
jgi:HK97 family phage major capsid protein